MPVARTVIRSGQYHDSIELMRLALEIEELDGVHQASLMMGTPANRRLLADAGLLDEWADQAGSNDLVIVLRADSELALDAAEAATEILLRPSVTQAGPTAEPRPRSMAQAVERQPDATLALISTPGPYAAAEAMKAIRSGLHVFLFSDNVTIDDEIVLKRAADARELLVMGPDCGTAIIGGAMLGFANVVRSGSIGLVGPSGTGIQEVTCLIDHLGGGVSHAIGTGSHDLSPSVGGITTRRALRALDADPSTRVIAVIAKPSGAAEAQDLIDFAEALETPVVMNVLGLDPDAVRPGRVVLADTLAEAAELAVALEGGHLESGFDQHDSDLVEAVASLRAALATNQQFIRGLFSGGTLCAEAARLLALSGLEVHSNVSTPGSSPIEDLPVSVGHTLIDLGADELTIGRPHPMIDFRTRTARLLEEARDPTVAVVLLDVVLGYGVHPDPVSELAPAIQRAREEATAQGRSLHVVGSVCGTSSDPQDLQRQEQELRRAGAMLLPSNAAAARFAALLVGQISAPRVKRAPRADQRRAPAGGGAARNGSTVKNGRLSDSLGVVSVGVESFGQTLAQHGVPVTQLDWRPPGSGDPAVAWALARISSDRLDSNAPGSHIDVANRRAVQGILDARPRVVDVVKAREVLPGMDRRLLHAGPPITWERMCGPMQGALIGATVFEGWARDERYARWLLEHGEIELSTCHQSGAVGPMAGVISPSMSLWVVRNDHAGNVAYSNLNEGLGSVLRFGAFSPEVLDRLRWMEDELVPTIRRALVSLPEGIDLRAMLAQALQMGDDGHNRNVAATSLLFRALSLAMLDVEPSYQRARAALAFIDGNNHFFLNLSMAAAKVALDAAHGVPGSSMVTAMARNGVDFGIRVSGLGDRWLTAPAQVPEGLFFPGYSAEDANPDMGDSAITETAGLGGFAMGTAPALVRFVGGTANDALAYTREMMDITLARNTAYGLPPLGFVGTPTGIDVRLVVDTGILPVINSGIAHRLAGLGQVGAGIVRAPMGCFEAAVLALADSVGTVADGVPGQLANLGWSS